jgi:nucleolar protein 58
MTGSSAQYNTATDSVAVDSKPSFLATQPTSATTAAEQRAVEAILEVKEEKRDERDGKKEKKDKKKRKSEAAAADVSMNVDGDESMVVGETKEERRARKEAKKAVS